MDCAKNLTRSIPPEHFVTSPLTTSTLPELFAAAISSAILVEPFSTPFSTFTMSSCSLLSSLAISGPSQLCGCASVCDAASAVIIARDAEGATGVTSPVSKSVRGGGISEIPESGCSVAVSILSLSSVGGSDCVGLNRDPLEKGSVLESSSRPSSSWSLAISEVRGI